MELIYSYSLCSEACADRMEGDFNTDLSRAFDVVCSLFISTSLGYPGWPVDIFTARLLMEGIHTTEITTSFNKYEGYDPSIHNNIDKTDITGVFAFTYQEECYESFFYSIFPIGLDNVQNVYEYMSDFGLGLEAINFDYIDLDSVIDDDNYISFSFFDHDSPILAKVDIWNDNTKDIHFVDFFVEKAANTCESFKEMEVSIAYRE